MNRKRYTTMKKNYTAPRVEVVDVQMNEGVLMDVSGGSAGGGNGSEIKGEINTGIDFDDMTGTEIIRKNPWDSQW